MANARTSILTVENERREIPSTMRAAVYRGVNDVRLEEVPVPEVGPGEILVRVHTCGICGTDLKKFASSASANAWWCFITSRVENVITAARKPSRSATPTRRSDARLVSSRRVEDLRNTSG